MIYTELTNRTLRIAYAAYEGQVDKTGMPYILHPFHLAEQMDDEVSTCVALLHDIEKAERCQAKYAKAKAILDGEA